MRKLQTFFVVLLCVVPLSTTGARDPAGLCDDAAHMAAISQDVPKDILLAITRVETDRGSGPWPWTINQAGTGAWFESAEQAVVAAQAILESGETNLDIGCFQLNHRWHGAAFSSLSAMIDPENNASYAAWFLSDLYRQQGSWPAAVAAYHSRTEQNAERYLARIETVLASMTAVPLQQPALHENGYPFLQPGFKGAAGSLVPLQSARGALVTGTP